MVRVNNLLDNKNVKQLDQKGPFIVFEHQNDLSISPWEASDAYFMAQMNVRKRQALCMLNNSAVKLQAGAMQWMSGNVEMSANTGGVGGLLGKMVKGAVTGESAVKPLYRGTGYVMLEPTYHFLLLEDVASWGPAGVMLDDGLFLACEDGIKENVQGRKNLSSALLGGKGLFNLVLSGNGVCVLESPVPREELIEFELENDVVKIDGNMAIAWSAGLQFTVEKAGTSLIGSGLSGEGFVNVYRGTGKILMAPTMAGTIHDGRNGPEQKTANSSQGLLSSVKNSVLNA